MLAVRYRHIPTTDHGVFICFLVAFQMTGYTVLLIACLGPSVLAGIGVMALLIPVRPQSERRS